MPEIFFVHPDGARSSIKAPTGSTLMQVAVSSGISEIVADCGGACCCGTCHVYIDPDWLSKLPAPDPAEDAMLEFVAAARLPTSRLACQIVVQDVLEGAVITLPDKQTTST